MAASIATERIPRSARLGRMRVPIPALAAAAVLAAARAAGARAGAGARARLGGRRASRRATSATSAASRSRDDGRDGADGSASRSGMEIEQRPRERARLARRRRTPRARRARDARRRVAVRRARDRRPRDAHGARRRRGRVDYGGRVSGLVVDGTVQRRPRGHARRSAPAAPTVTVNDAGAGLRVRLTRAVAGFASGTTVVDRRGRRRGDADGADPDATPRRADADADRDAGPARPARGGDDAHAERAARSRGSRRAAPRARPTSSSPSTATSAAPTTSAARAQIGPHQGNDCFAPFGSPVLAVADGTLNRVGTLPISGNRLWLQDRPRRRVLLRAPLRLRARGGQRPAGQGGHAARLRRQHRRRRADAAARALRDPPGRPRRRSTRTRSSPRGSARRPAHRRLARALRHGHRAAPRRARRGARLHRRGVARRRAPGGRPSGSCEVSCGATWRRSPAPARARWSRCTRTPPRRRTGRRAPSCAGPRTPRARPPRRRCAMTSSLPMPPRFRFCGCCALAQRDGGVLERLGRLLDVLLQLLVLEDLLRRMLAVLQPAHRRASGLERAVEVLRGAPRPRRAP